MIWRALCNFFAQNIAMDLGTANTLLYTNRLGLAINEPSVVAYDQKKRTIVAIGAEAKGYIGRTPDQVTTIRPLKEGVIADFDMTCAMVSYFVERMVSRLRLFKPMLVVCIPMGITQIEKRAVIDAAISAGAREVKLIDEPMAATIGAGRDVHGACGHMVLDVGGGTTEVGVISLDGIVTAQCVRVAGDAMDEAVQHYIREEFRVEIGANTAERLKIMLGAAENSEELGELQISGRDLVHGLPRVITVPSTAVSLALAPCVQQIKEAVLNCLESTPPTLAQDILQEGLLLVGGGSLLHGLDSYLAKATGLTVKRDNDPLTTVLRGTAKAMLDLKGYKYVFIN